MYLVTCSRPDFGYPFSYLSQFLFTASKSHLPAAKRLLWNIKDTKDLKLSVFWSHALENTLDGYSDPEYGNCLETQQTISSNLF
jgi:hypothetical protein